MASNDHSKYSTINPIKKALIRNFQNHLLAVIKQFNPESILDVGCGEGHVIRLIRNNDWNLKLVGLDIDKNSLKMAKEKIENVNFIYGDIYELPFDDNSFDLVICSEVLEHLKKPALAMKELNRVASKFLFLSVPHEPYFWVCNFITFNHISSWGNAPGHINHWGLKSFRELAMKYFENYDITLSFPWITLYGTVL